MNKNTLRSFLTIILDDILNTMNFLRKLGYYAASSGNFLPMFRGNLLVRNYHYVTHVSISSF